MRAVIVDAAAIVGVTIAADDVSAVIGVVKNDVDIKFIVVADIFKLENLLLIVIQLVKGNNCCKVGLSMVNTVHLLRLWI